MSHKIHPPIDDKPADICRGFTDFSSDVELTTQSGCPTYPAGRIVVSNTAGSAQTLSCDGPDGVAFALSVPDDTVMEIEAQISRVNSATGTLGVVAHWWVDSSTRFNA